MSTEGAWVGQQVARHAGTCRLVLGSRGRYVVADTSHDDNEDQQPVWDQIKGKAALNLAGDNHIYGRLAPIDGVTVFMVGAGGHGLRGLSGTQQHTVMASKTGTIGGLHLTLERGKATYRWVDRSGTVHDAGTIGCTPA